MAATRTAAARGRLAGLMRSWLSRRGPLEPPLTLKYRQIFILPTAFGWVLAALMSAMLVGSLNFNNNLGLLTTFVVASLSLLSLFHAYRNQAGLRITGASAQPVFAGQPLGLTITLLEQEGRRREGIRFTCDGHIEIIDVGALRSASAVLPISTHRRGWRTLPRIRIATRYPLGLFEAWSWFWAPAPALVYPCPASPAPPLPRHGGHEGLADRQYEGEEFHSLRPWRAGDPLHRIAWKASQRHRELLSRQFQAESDRQIRLRLDDAPGRGLEDQLSVLTAWVLVAAGRNLSFTLELPGRIIGPDSGPRHQQRCLKALALHA